MNEAPCPHRLSAESLSAGPTTRRIGRRIVVLPEVDSTNAYALTRLAEPGDRPDGACIFAEYQTAGRGRLGRRWQTPRGAGLILTALLIERSDATSISRWMMASALAVAEAVGAATDVEPTIRWPNDLYVRDRKLGGILIESRPWPAGRAVAIGIGVNCYQQPGHFPPELRDRATSLDIESSAAVDRTRVARAVLERLDHYLADRNEPSDAVLARRWGEHSADLGARAVLTEKGHTYRGRILDVHPISGLLLALDTGARRCFDPSTTART